MMNLQVHIYIVIGHETWFDSPLLLAPPSKGACSDPNHTSLKSNPGLSLYGTLINSFFFLLKNEKEQIGHELKMAPEAWHSLVPAYQQGSAEVHQYLALIAQPEYCKQVLMWNIFEFYTFKLTDEHQRTRPLRKFQQTLQIIYRNRHQ